MQHKGFFYIILAGMLWGFVGPLSRLAFQEGVQPLEVAFWRALLASVLFGVHAVVVGQVRVKANHLPAVLLFGFVGVSLFFGSYLSAIERGGAALASVLLYTAPAWVAVMSRLLFKEAMTLVKTCALGLTILGVVGVSAGSNGLGGRPEIHVTSPAIILGLLAGFFYSLYFIFGKRFSDHYSAPNLFLYTLPVGALGLFPAIQFADKTAVAWVALACLAIFCTYGAYFCYYVSLRYLEPSRAAITATIEPVVASVVAYFWWGESFGATGYLGSALILTAVVLIVRDHGESKGERPA